MLQHDRDGARRFACWIVEADGNAAERDDGQIQRHAHAAHRATHDDALAMQIDDTPASISRLVGGFETHGQREGVEPRWAAPPGGDPAGFHFDAPKGRLPPGCCRPVVARPCQDGIAIRLISLVNLRYRRGK